MSATERAYHVTRARILDGVLAGGDVITEGQVSSSLGISRTPVREAFLRLQAEGLLQLYPKRGAVVVPVSLEEATSVMEAREIIETHAATKLLTAADTLPRALLDSLWERCAEQQRFAHAGDHVEFMESDTLFHLTIVQSGENPFFVDLLRNLRDHQRRLSTSASQDGIVERMLAAQREHVGLVERLEKGDLDLYLSGLRAHLRAGRARLLAAANGR
ncbi:DNA-binding GntR family transcriptional regulator [Kineosphaera limosa]|nr:GntR family transcriptional regulator [Kineosphaera limosa]NYD99782.1 DNA-binding GntR family transcriptional regulator [Kineosphaera limosa]